MRFSSRKLRKISPYSLGVFIGLVCVTVVLPGGSDGWQVFLLPWSPKTTAPGWAHLVLSPLTLCPYWPCPCRWTALVILTYLVTRFACQVWENDRWWMAVLSLPPIWNMWLGQIEFILVASAAIGWLVVQKRLPPAFWGVAGLGLVTKVQVGWGLAALFTYWIWREQGIKALAWAAATAVAVLLVALLAYPDWIGAWFTSLQHLNERTKVLYSNPVWIPLGLVAWLAAVMPLRMERVRRVRLVATATLLGSPYLLPYHCATLMTMLRHPAVFVVTFLPTIPILLFNDYHWAWVIPTAVLLVELHELRHIRLNQLSVSSYE